MGSEKEQVGLPELPSGVAASQLTGQEAQHSAGQHTPKIFAFSNVRGGGDGIAYAMAEDGTVLGSHWCSHEFYVPHDLGVVEGSRQDRHETYAAHYPGGYEMEFIRAADVEAHEGLKRAFELNQAQAKAAKAVSQ